MDRALEDNVFLRPELVLPALRHFGGENPVVLAFIYRGGLRGERLVGCAPLSRLRPALRAPFGALSTLAVPHLQQCYPALDRDEAAPALAALFGWLEAGHRPPLLLEQIGSDAPTWGHLQAEVAARRLPLWREAERVRPMLDRHESFEAYLQTLPPSRRKGYRRRLRDAERLGPVTFRLHRDLAAVEDLADRFMAVERLGWKGEAGSALADRPAEAAFFREVVSALGARRSLFFVELTIGGRTVAMTSNFVAGRTLFCFKTAYDPAFGDCSPGILAELEGVRLLHEDPGLLRADSCSSADSYVRAYFRQERRLQRLWVATGGPASRLLVRTRRLFDEARAQGRLLAAP